MKKWIVTYTPDAVNYKETEVLGTSYTDAYVNFYVKHPNEVITELKEA